MRQVEHFPPAACVSASGFLARADSPAHSRGPVPKPCAKALGRSLVPHPVALCIESEIP